MRAEPILTLQTTQINGDAMAYMEYGRGEPVVLVHGSLSDCRYWKAQMAPLGHTYRVLAVCLRHYWPAQTTTADFSLTQHAEDILAFIQQVAGGSAHVIGHSRGGRVALEAALLNPPSLRSLTLADPGLLAAKENAPRGDFYQAALDLIQQGNIEAGLALFIDTVSGPETWQRMVPWFKQMARDNAHTLFAQTREKPHTLTLEQRLRITQPTLLIGGALSPAPYPLILDMLQSALPNAQRVTIAGSSHGMNLGNPRAFNLAVDQFLSLHRDTTAHTAAL